MLRMIYGKRRKDGIGDHTMRDMTGVEKMMDDERALVKAKYLVVDCSKKNRSKQKKEAVEMDVLARGFRGTDAQDRSVWRLGRKNLPLIAGKTSRITGG